MLVILWELVILIISLLIGVILNFVPLGLVVWATRNVFRFFIFFISCICFLSVKDLDKLFDIFYKLQWLNIALALYQYFILGLEQDYLGGIFGHGGGAGLSIFSSLLVSYSICAFIIKKISFKKVSFVMLSSISINALAEQKVFYIQFVVIVVLAILLCNFSWNKFKIAGISIFTAMLGINMLKNLFPLQYEVLVDLGNISDYMSTIGGGYNISRFGAFQQITDMFFENNLLQQLFGFGFGNGEFSSISIFTSDFYNKYGYLHYRGFMHQWTFLETGYVGFILYLTFFIVLILYAFWIKNKVAKSERYYVIVSIIMTIICIFSMWVNALLRADFAYIAFFGISIAGIVAKNVIFNDTVKKGKG